MREIDEIRHCDDDGAAQAQADARAVEAVEETTVTEAQTTSTKTRHWKKGRQREATNRQNCVAFLCSKRTTPATASSYYWRTNRRRLV